MRSASLRVVMAWRLTLTVKRKKMNAPFAWSALFKRFFRAATAFAVTAFRYEERTGRRLCHHADGVVIVWGGDRLGLPHDYIISALQSWYD